MQDIFLIASPEEGVITARIVGKEVCDLRILASSEVSMILTLKVSKVSDACYSGYS